MRPIDSIALDDVVVGARFLAQLPSFLRSPLGVEQAREALCERLARRETDFLTLARAAIYGYRGSPYRQLLRLIGCQYGDLEQLTRQEGIEGALLILYRQGAYLTVEEFKGRRPVVRGSTTLRFHPARLRNARSAAGILNATSGSRGTGTVVPVDLAFLAERSVNTRLFLDARGSDHWQHAIWEAPGSSVITLLRYSRCGAVPTRWFTQLDPTAARLHPRYRWVARLVRWGSLAAARPLPRPTVVPLDDPMPIVRWARSILQAGRTPHVDTFTSPAVRLCQAALDRGTDLAGGQLTVTGEPLTNARLEVIRRSGASAVPSYRTAEAGAIGYGCLAPEAPDEVHQYHDLVALIQTGRPDPGTGLPEHALLLTTLRPRAPLVMLNVSLGDQATMSRRACGCPLEGLGWTAHLQTIRSFEKLTAGGVTFLDADVIQVLEEVLPRRFGGGPTDYQLLEEETADGRPSLRLLVNPAIGEHDLREIADTFLAAVGRSSPSGRLWELLWRQGNVLQVERRPPRAMAAGKILHLHRDRPRRGGR